jgi:two-component system OmpR family sensor kinase
VSVSVGDDDGFVALRVADNGPGIPLAEQERVFERFARVDKARARSQGSSGLGLAIARALVRRHGGSIELASVPGDGATFTVRLPRGG